MKSETKKKLPVPSLDGNKAYLDGHVLLREEGHEASDARKHRKNARDALTDADLLGANYAQAKQQIDGLVKQRTAAITTWEQLEKRVAAEKARIEAIDRNIEEREKAIEGLPEEARRDFAGELAGIDRQRRDEAEKARRCRDSGEEIPAAVIERSLDLEREWATVKAAQDDHEARIRERREYAQDQIRKALTSLATSLRADMARKRTNILALMEDRGTLYRLFPEHLASDATPFWERTREAAQIVTQLAGVGSVNDELERSFWSEFKAEQRVQLMEAMQLPKTTRQVVPMPRRREQRNPDPIMNEQF